jgi:hypothetical protein
VHFGEGDYSTMGQLIRQLLQAARPHLSVPTPAGVPDKTPAGQMNPETYLGYAELQYLDPPEVTRDAPAVYHFPASLPLGALGLAGTWTDHAQEATAGQGAELELGFLAQDVYLVLGGTGTLDELFEMFTWSQLGLHRMPIGLLDVAEYWQPLLQFLEHAVNERFLRAEHFETLLVEHDPGFLLDRLSSHQPLALNKWMDRRGID